MKSQNYIYIVLAIIVVTVAVYFAMKLPMSSSNNNEPITATSTEAVKIVSYTNTRYKYTFNYPSTDYVRTLYEEDRSTSTESAAIELYGQNRLLTIETRLRNISTTTQDANLKEYYRMMNLDLKTYAEEKRIQLINNKDGGIQNVKAGELVKINFSGKDAYIMYVDASQPKENKLKFIYVDNGNDRYEIRYSVNDYYEQKIIDSFKFLN